MHKGVGSVIESWIPDWALSRKRSSCNCNKIRDEMDALGPDGVEANIKKYVEHFVHQRKYLRRKFRVAPDLLLRAWVELMIKNACNRVRRHDRK